ncbi:hypothetical protein H5410_004876 [Solanum commersonii]|uniref:Reverse transcriptase domain-containing protein n=1 Tax=Solanum commersonii TaxID=4109 RepID=A0A9J6A5K5_SOLCO|nr:hypothetical protein H5410_004876 [Solanum commersonii]
MGNGMEISHLLYADDSLVFYEPKVTQIRHLRAILTIFEGVSGLHINWQKSCLYPVNQVPNMQILAENLGCQVASLPTKYLGMPVGAKNKELEVELARWKSQYLSLGSRLTLIKSVMYGQPTYMMSLFPPPVSIEKKFNKARTVFLWQGNKEKKGYNLVKWDKVILSKEQGGLGIKKLRADKESLLKKWLWRFCCEDMARRFISQNYGLLNSWITEEVTGTFECSVWKTIRRLWLSFNNNLKYKIGNGEKPNF